MKYLNMKVIFKQIIMYNKLLRKKKTKIKVMVMMKGMAHKIIKKMPKLHNKLITQLESDKKPKQLK